MGEFAKLIRKSKTPHPTQQQFDVGTWKQVYSRLSSPTESDFRLYETGLWLFGRMEKVRKKLKGFALKNIPKDSCIRLFEGQMNRVCKQISQVDLPFEKIEVFNTAYAVQSKYSKNVIGSPLHPGDLLERAIDGGHLPLRIALISQTDNVNEDRYAKLSDEEVFHRMNMSFVLGQYYSLLEELWTECLWNGWYVQVHKDVYVFRPPDDDIPLIQAVSEYRRRALGVEMAHQSVQIWQHNLPDLLKRQLSYRLQVRIEGKGKQQKYIPYVADYDPKVPPQGFIYRLIAEETYFKPLLDLELPRYGRLTINRLLSAWEIMRSLAEEILAKVPEVEDVKDIKTFMRYSPILHINRLAALLRDSLRISIEDANYTINLFTFDPKTRFELWIKPFVRIDKDRVIPTLAPLIYGNMLRNIEFWIREGGLDLSERGPLFEQEARDEIRRAIKSSKILKNAAVHSTSIRISTNEIEEEIDIVLWIKNRILLGEAKCLLFPTEPIEYYRYFYTLRGAAAQIKRKAIAVANNKKSLLEKLELQDKVAEHEVEFLPFILTNQPLGVGFPIDGIPVVDLIVLTRYLNEGILESNVLIDEKGKKKSGRILFFYEDEIEAASNIDNYLKDPPQIALYKRYVRVKDYEQAKLDGEDQIGAIIGFEVELPVEPLEFEYRRHKQEV